MTVCVRSYETSDAPGLAKLFSESVTNGTGEHYSDEERKAWASAISSADKWSSRLASMTTLVAEDSKGLAGFMTLEADGHIDLAYVRSDLIGKGVAAKLYKNIEAIARERKVDRLYSEASHLARQLLTHSCRQKMVLVLQQPNH